MNTSINNPSSHHNPRTVTVFISCMLILIGMTSGTAVFGQNRVSRSVTVKEPKEKSPAEREREFNRSRKAYLAAIAARKKKGGDDSKPEIIPMQFLGESESLKALSMKDQPPVSKEYAKRLIEDDEGTEMGRLLKSVAKPSTNNAPLVDSFMQINTPRPLAAIAGANFEGPGIGLASFPNQGLLPPDTTMAVGLNQIVAWVNLKLVIFDKSGNVLVGPTNGNQLFAGLAPTSICRTQNNGDPILQYDRLADRWVLSQFAFNSTNTQNAQCFAVSTTGDPAGSYYLYEYDFPNQLPDYGKLGIWNDAYYTSYNMFAYPGGTYAGTKLCANDRANMLAGNPASMICFTGGSNVDGSLFAALPADLDGTTLPSDTTRGGLFMVTDWFNLNSPPYSIHILRMKPDFVTPANSTLSDGYGGGANSFITFPYSGIGACSDLGGQCIPQPGTTRKLDTLAARLMYRLSYRNRGGVDSLVVTQGMDPDGAGAQQSAVRWYEIRNPLGDPSTPATKPFIYQSSTFNPDSSNRWMSSAAMNGNGDILIGYSISSATVFPSIAVAGRQQGDPLNTLQAEQIAMAGTGVQTSSAQRWGDYVTMQVDPSDDKTFWFIGEYYAATSSAGWQTRIVSYTFPATLVVDNTTDNGSLNACTPAPNDCSLRGAIGDANASVGDDTINFDPTIFSTPQTITLAGSELPLGGGGTTTINGPGANLLTVSANGASRVISAGSTAVINGLTITGGNSGSNSGGGISSTGNLTINDATVSASTTSGAGGGVFGQGGTITIARSTISGNSAGFASGVAANPGTTINLVNSTVSGNSSNNGGSVFCNIGANLNITSSTISGNSPGSGVGGIDSNNGTVTVKNSIIAKNTGSNPDVTGGGITSLGYNIVGNVGGVVAFSSTGDQTGVDPLLGPLQNNGGPTSTMALLPGSPAVDKGNGFGLSSDQRGQIRPIDDPTISNVGDGADIGAVEKYATTVSITSDTPDPSVTGQPYAVTASITVTAPGGGIPSGTITVTDGSQNCLIALPSNSCNLGNSSAGAKTLTASYSGDGNFNSSTSGGASHTVNKANTLTALSADLNPAGLGQPVTFSATLSAAAPGSGTPTGTVTFKDGATTLCSASTLSAGVATCTTSSLALGNHTITTSYGGDTNFNGSNGSYAQSISKAVTATTLTAAPNPSVYGQAVTMTATVSATPPGAGTPTGTVSFTYDGISICPGTVAAAGQAVCVMPSLTVGTHAIGASYSGDSNFFPSAGVLSPQQVVGKAATTTAITNVAALAGQTNVGTPYPVTWQVTVNSPGAGVPTGSVTVSDGTGATCNAAIAVGTCSLPSNTVGAKSITATYGGDANFALSASAPAVTTHTVVVTISGNIKQFVQGGPNTNLASVSVGLAGSNTPGTTTTDPSGNYSFTGVFSGAYVITPNPATPSPGKTYDPITRTVTGVLANVSGANFVAYNSPGPVPRQLRAVNQYISPGQTAVMPIILSSLGTEVSNTFSLSYDTNTVAGIPAVACGAAAPGCTLTVDTSQSGKLGISVTPTAGYAAGDREIARVTFQTVNTIQPNAPVTFGSVPTASLAKDASNNPLPVTYVSGFIVFSQNLEGDLSNRNTGNGTVDPTDLTILRQIATGSIVPDPAFNEFQRADVSPAATRGDGQVDATDVAQERQYAVGNAVPPAASGPFVGTVVPIGPITQQAGKDAAVRSRTMRVGSLATSNGSRITIPVELTTQGDETAASFTLNFDASKLLNPSIEMGTGADASTVLTTNTTRSSNGLITVLVDGSSTLSPQLVNLSFDVARSAPSGETRISFANGPTPSVVSNASGDKLATAFQDGIISIGDPRSAKFSLSGRVTAADGRAIRNAVVTLADSNGIKRTTTTSSFGYYTFDGISAGETLVIGAAAKRFRFATRTVTLADSLTDVDFVSQE